MARRIAPAATLQELVQLAVPVCQQAERQLPRTRGRPPAIPYWFLAVLIMVALLEHKKTKSAQYRFLQEHRPQLQAWTGQTRFPARSTYFERYRRAHRLYQEAIRLQGQQAVAQGLADPTIVAVDKSLVEGLGPPWHKRDRAKGEVPAGVDRDTTWGYSTHHGWVQGYSYEVVVTATPAGTAWPLVAPGPAQQRRKRRKRFLASRRGRRIYRQRSRTVEPFHEWLARVFDVERAWHRGLGNNQTQLLGAIFTYQVLLRYNHQHGASNGQVKAIVDRL